MDLSRPRSSADAILDVCREYGAEFIFSSPGSEWPPLWEALARARLEGRGPGFVDTRHELLTVSMALGYQSRSGRLPIAALHSGIGPLNAAMALRAACLERQPLVVLVGETAGFGELPGPDPGYQWARMVSDVGGPAAVTRPFVKRATSAASAELIPGLLADACRIALTPPQGPVLLSIPIEFMHRPAPPGLAGFAPPPEPVGPVAAAIAAVARDLVSARQPLILTERAGRDPENVPLLVELAERLAIPVVEVGSVSHLNFPRDHPLHQGFSAKALLERSDLVLLVGCKLPWYPSSNGPKGARVVVVDEDPAHDLLPYWGVRADRVLGGHLPTTLGALNEEVRVACAETAVGREGSERLADWAARHRKQRDRWTERAQTGARARPIDARWAAFQLAEALPPDALVSLEVITQRKVLLQHLKCFLPGSFYSGTTGGLGMGLGVALGLKLAARERLVVAVEGDGSFHYNPVLAALGCAVENELPLLVVVLNNQGYRAMKRAHLRAYPSGWAAETRSFFGTEIEAPPDYAAIARVFGGHGEQVQDPALLAGALERAVREAEGGRLALVDCWLDPEG